MGWKISVVTIENKHHFNNDLLLIEKAGFRQPKLKETTTFEQALSSKNTIAIGEINNTLVICDNYKLTEHYISGSNQLNLTETEENLVGLFPNSEILCVACHSVTDTHGYSLIKDAKKQRVKIVHQEGKIEFGTPFKEEQNLYEQAITIEDNLFWDLDQTQNEENYLTESNLMEEFTFEVLKRSLGVLLNQDEANNLLATKNFRIYTVKEQIEDIKIENAKIKTWQKMLFFIVIFLFIQLIKYFLK
jgi:hypothetical protein